MSGLTFEQLRLPAALILVIIAAFVFMPRGGGPASTAADASVSEPSAGEPGGAVTSTATPVPATPVPTLTPAATSPSATPEPTEAPVADDGFSAELLACRSISGSECNGELGRLSADAASFTALVRFTDATAGDVIGVTLSGDGGTIAGSPYTLRGGGDGYYYSVFNVGGLPGGEYGLVATRNGSEVAATSFRFDD